MTKGFACLILGGTALMGELRADDWPEWLGEGRAATWREEGIRRELKEAPKVLWRTPVSWGYSGPSIAEGRVYLMDFVLEDGEVMNNASVQAEVGGEERVRCFDAESGKPLWTHSERRKYKVSYPGGPRSTPTVDGGQVFALGVMGHLTCLSTDGEVLWKKDFGKEYEAPVPMWGHAAHPLVYGDMVICMVGGRNSLVVAFDRSNGKELWRSLDGPHAGYCPPQVIEHEGRKQLVTWHPLGVSGHDLNSGRMFWTAPIKPTGGSAIAMPRKLGDQLFVSGYNRVGGLLNFKKDEPGVTFAWRSGPKDGVYCVNSTPYLLGETIYGVDVDQSALIAVRMKDGKRLWQSRAPTLDPEIAKRARVPRYGTAFLVYHSVHKQFWIFSETGDLILAELSPERYRELGRAPILEPTNTSGRRAVLWCQPAFAMKSMFIRNDRELIRVDLASPGAGSRNGEK